MTKTFGYGDFDHIAQRAQRAAALARTLRHASEAETMGAEEIDAITRAIEYELADVQKCACEAMETIEAQAAPQ